MTGILQGLLASLGVGKSKGLFTWGRNQYFQLGTGNNITASSPVQVGSSLTTWSKLSCGSSANFAITDSGTLFAWGQNYYGQLGINNRNYVSLPTQVGALTTWAEVAAGPAFSGHCIAITTSGTLFAWGKNNSGQLGLNDRTDRSSPVQVGSLTTWSKASCGREFCAAITTSGTLFTWGNNGYGRLGLGDTNPRSSPVQVGTLTNWSKVNAGSYNCAAITTSGTLFAWGYANQGSLGIGNSYNRSSPVQVGALTTWAEVAMGADFGSGLTTSGALFTWGSNFRGQLGINTGDYGTSSPVQVGSSSWSKLSAGGKTCAAIRTSGALFTWGYNDYGQLGINTKEVTGRSSPVQVGSLTTWSQVVVEFKNCMAILD